MHALTETNRFATFFWSVYDETRRTLTWVNAGHNAPMLLRASGDLERLTAGGPPLGALPGASYREATTTLSPGDVLIIFTDGVTEAANPADEEFGEARLERILRDNAGSRVGRSASGFSRRSWHSRPAFPSRTTSPSSRRGRMR